MLVTARIKKLEDRFDELDEKLNRVVEVCGAVADDTLRMYFVLDELNRAAQLPELPWEAATARVELHHAMRAAKEEKTDGEGVPATRRVEELKKTVQDLREVYVASLKVGGS